MQRIRRKETKTRREKYGRFQVIKNLNEATSLFRFFNRFKRVN